MMKRKPVPVTVWNDRDAEHLLSLFRRGYDTIALAKLYKVTEADALRGLAQARETERRAKIDWEATKPIGELARRVLDGAIGV